MKVQVKKLPHSEVELTITVPYETFQKSEKRALETLGKDLKVPGFRSGHIPEEVIRKEVGEEGLKQVTLEFLLPQTYSAAIKEHNIPVIAPPKVEIKTPIQKPGDELIYVAQVAVMPEVKVGNYKKIKVARKKPEATPKQVEETIQMILDRFAKWKEVKRAAQINDRVEIDFEGFDPGSEKALPNTASKNHPLILGSNVMISGFEDALIGMAPGDHKEFELTFPANYRAEELKGKKVKFKVDLKRLEEKILEPLTEELITKLTGQKQSVDDFKHHVAEDLKTEMQVRADQEHDAAVVSEIIKITQVDLPETLVNEEIQYLLEEKKTQVGRQGLTWEQYLKHINKTEANFAHDHKKTAVERLQARLGVQHILQDAKIQVNDEEIAAHIEKLVARYPEKDRKTVRNHYKKDSEGHRNLKNSLAADKLIDMLSV